MTALVLKARNRFERLFDALVDPARRERTMVVMPAGSSNPGAGLGCANAEVVVALPQANSWTQSETETLATVN